MRQKIASNGPFIGHSAIRFSGLNDTSSCAAWGTCTVPSLCFWKGRARSALRPDNSFSG
ncbi:hypothetical protein FQZ97_1127770 [compost metagenome]